MGAVGEVMTSLWKLAGTALALAAALAIDASATSQVPAPQKKPPVARAVPPAPAYIHGRVTDLGKGFNGRVGIAVRSIDDGWSTGWNEWDSVQNGNCPVSTPAPPPATAGWWCYPE